MEDEEDGEFNPRKVRVASPDWYPSVFVLTDVGNVRTVEARFSVRPFSVGNSATLVLPEIFAPQTARSIPPTVNQWEGLVEVKRPSAATISHILQLWKHAQMLKLEYACAMPQYSAQVAAQLWSVLCSPLDDFRTVSLALPFYRVVRSENEVHTHVYIRSLIATLTPRSVYIVLAR